MNNDNISTPQLEKFISDFTGTNNASWGKTPGSALTFLTPSTGGIQQFFPGFLSTPNGFKTEENSINVTVIPDGNQIYPITTNNSQFRRQNSEVNPMYMNPNEIFSNSNNKFAHLTDVTQNGQVNIIHLNLLTAAEL